MNQKVNQQNRVLFIHVAEKESMKWLERFFRSYSDDIEFQRAKLENGLYIWPSDQSSEEKSDILDKVKMELKEKGWLAEEISYEQLRKDEEISDEEWRALLPKESSLVNVLIDSHYQ